MKKSLLVLLVMGVSTFAQAYSINMTCGQVIKARNGKILKRLEPNLFGLNAKFVLMTKFNNPIGYNVRGRSADRYDAATFQADEKTFTYFSLKDKYLELKKEIKTAIKKSKKEGTDLYACVGHIDVSLRYSGSHVYLSSESAEDAMKKMLKQGARHTL